MATQKIVSMVLSQINQYCEDGKWFWVAGLARETWPALRLVKDQLHPVALQAVEHYEEEGQQS